MTENQNTQVLRVMEYMERIPRLLKWHGIAKKFGMNPTQAIVLFQIHKLGHMKGRDLASILGLTNGAVTQICDELEKIGVIERVRSSEDRRVVHNSLTERGHQVVSECIAARMQVVTNILTQLGPTDAAELERLIGRMVEIMEEDVKHREDDSCTTS